MDTTDLKFLLVENDDLDVENITRSFRRQNISNPIVHAKNGHEALDILRGGNDREQLRRPYIIFLTLQAPAMSGLQFLRELRADSQLASAPVFVLTTADKQSELESAFLYDISGYIVKPINITQLFQALSTLNMSWRLTDAPLDP